MTPSAPAWSGLFEKTPTTMAAPVPTSDEEDDEGPGGERVAPADAEDEGREQDDEQALDHRDAEPAQRLADEDRPHPHRRGDHPPRDPELTGQDELCGGRHRRQEHEQHELALGAGRERSRRGREDPLADALDGDRDARQLALDGARRGEGLVERDPLAARVRRAAPNGAACPAIAASTASRSAETALCGWPRMTTCRHAAAPQRRVVAGRDDHPDLERSRPRPWAVSSSTVAGSLSSSCTLPSRIASTSSVPRAPLPLATMPIRGATRPPYIVPSTTMRMTGRTKMKNRPGAVAQEPADVDRRDREDVHGATTRRARSSPTPPVTRPIATSTASDGATTAMPPPAARSLIPRRNQACGVMMLRAAIALGRLGHPEERAAEDGQGQGRHRDEAGRPAPRYGRSRR